MLSSAVSAQDRFAIDASASCWGEVQPSAALSPATPWTLDAWVYLIDDDLEEQIVLRADPQPDLYELYVTDGIPVFHYELTGGQSGETGGTIPLPLGLWTHLACTYTNGGTYLYMNGILSDFYPYTLPVVNAPGPIFIGGGDQLGGFTGYIDEVRLSDTLRYDAEFDPFEIPMVDLRVGNQEIPDWVLGTEPGDLMEAWDYNSLYDIIDGAAVTYIANNFQYAIQQLYYGTIATHDVTLTLWMTDQGTAEDAQALYNEPVISPFFFQLIDTIGAEARLDTGLLFDWSLDFYRDHYYTKITVSKEWDEQEALEVVTAFATIVDQNILTRFQFADDDRTLALWHFDEGTGSTFTDASGNGHDGQLTNAAWIDPGSVEKKPWVTSAMLLEGSTLLPEIDDDDYARLTFSEPFLPVNIHAGNIDELLTLSENHTWLSGSAELGSVTWNGSMDTLTISFSLNGGTPTIANNDTIYPNPSRFLSEDSVAIGGYRFIRFEDISSVKDPLQYALPETITLYSPYPNPFNATAEISFAIPGRKFVSLSVYDLAGRKIATLIEGNLDAGVHRATWSAQSVSSGIYLMVLDSGADRYIQKTVLLK